MTGLVVERAPVQTEVDVRNAVARARSTARTWAALTLDQRRAHLRLVASSIGDRAAKIAEAVAAETGKPLVDALLEVTAACGMWRWVSRHRAPLLRSTAVWPTPMVTKQVRVVYEPYGVIGVIAPWNYPVAIPTQSIPYALLAGNTVVFKPSDLATRSGRLLAEAVNAAGVELVELVTGDARTGSALVSSGVDKVVFTGSGPVGTRILMQAAETLTPVVLELGGKDAAVVCSDANVEQAARAVVGAAFANAGQLCMATERAYVATEVYDRFVSSLVVFAEKLQVGPGPVDHVGPLTRPDQAPVLEARLADAVARGARIATGGRRVRVDGHGAFFAPTVVTDVTEDMDLMREESFGPILSVVRVPDADSAIALVNASAYGLNGSVYTSNRAEGMRLALAMQAGGVHINDALVGNAIPGVPFGGVKASGFGRLQGGVGLLEFVHSKTIISNRMRGLPPLAGSMARSPRPRPALLRGVLRGFYGSRATRRLRQSAGPKP